MQLSALPVTAVALGGLTFYLTGLATGAVTLVGWESGNAVSRGMVVESSGLVSTFGPLPVYLPAGRAVRADYTVDARFGALWLVVRQPFWSKIRATAHVAGERRGSVVFVAREAGWYKVSADTSPTFGRTCHAPGTSMVDILTGRDGCPHYDVRWSVSWHLADGRDTGPDHVAVPIAGADEPVPHARIGP